MSLNRHPFDLDPIDESPLDLFVEELPEQVQLASDCLSTASTVSSAETCLGSFFTLGSIISTGAKPPPARDRSG